MLRHPPADDTNADIVTNVLLMGTLHRAIPIALGLCLRAVTPPWLMLAWRCVMRERDEERRRSGNIPVAVGFDG